MPYGAQISPPFVYRPVLGSDWLILLAGVFMSFRALANLALTRLNHAT